MSSNIHFISAGAGSGKTYALTQKLEELLSSGQVFPAGVIATTFTKLSANELKEKVRSKLIISDITIANQIEQSLIGTVHGVCGELLKRFAFEAGIPTEQQVIEKVQGDILFYQAMETFLSNDTGLIRQMNSLSHRLQIINLQKDLLWRSEVKTIVDAARSNNQVGEDIRHLGEESAAQLLSYFPTQTTRDLDSELIEAITYAIEEIDTENDNTKATRDYLSLIRGVKAGLANNRLTWPEWISLTKKMPAKKSKGFAEPIADVAAEYEKHPKLHEDIRTFTENVFKIAADSLEAYQEIKTKKGLIDFVDQEQLLYKLLDHPTVIETLKEELQLLMVDEFQDTSPIQLALFLKLSKLADKVIWVGDVKQSIYGFRGSDPTLMAAVVDRVIEDGNPPEILKNSWRSTPDLVAYVNNLFVPAFSNIMTAEKVSLESARKPLLDETAVEMWRLIGGNKTLRTQALATGIRKLIKEEKSVVDQVTEQVRTATYKDIAILCRTHTNLNAVSEALAEANIPIKYKRPGLLSTPEGCLALACLRRLIDTRDTLASAEIHSLTTCESPEKWIADRIEFLNQPNVKANNWLENEPAGPISVLKEQRSRLPFLTPVETLRLAIDAGGVRKTVHSWGPSSHISQHRLNNLSALIVHAEEYVNQCASKNEASTASGLVLWLQVLQKAEEDTQAVGGHENAIQLVTHHGAKGLEWPIVVAMDFDTKLKPRLWGLSVIASPNAIDLNDPLAGRTLRYWPKFTGGQQKNVHLLATIEDGKEGRIAATQEIEEAKRLLYVSITRPRDALIITMGPKDDTGPWMETLDADWMLPQKSSLTLPDGTIIPSKVIHLEASDYDTSNSTFRPKWLKHSQSGVDLLPQKLSPSSVQSIEGAQIGNIIELGDRIEIKGEYDPAVLGSALHAIIATTILGQRETGRIIASHNLQETLTIGNANECTKRLLEAVKNYFSPINYYVEYPIQYTLENGQQVSGWIDLLVETKEGFILIDHKSSPRTKVEWRENALKYSGQLETYSNGISKIAGKPVISKWIHFAITGGLVEVIC